jgi:hypothetical protein
MIRRVAAQGDQRAGRPAAPTGASNLAARDDSLRLRSSNDGLHARRQRLDGQINRTEESEHD